VLGDGWLLPAPSSVSSLSVVLSPSPNLPCSFYDFANDATNKSLYYLAVDPASVKYPYPLARDYRQTQAPDEGLMQPSGYNWLFN
jgi:hypothetical protein